MKPIGYPILATPYWNEIHAEAWRRTREGGFLEWKRLATSVGVPIFSGSIQWAAGVSLPINLAFNISSGLLLYTLLIFVERFVRTRQIIAERDASQRATIETMGLQIEQKTRRIAELETPPAAFSAIIRNLQITSTALGMDQRLTVAVLAIFEVRYLGNEPGDTSIHGVQLHLRTLNLDSLVVDHIWPLNARLMERRFALDFKGVVANDFANAQKVGLRWQFSFKDIFDRGYESAIYLGG